jgi:ketosteroid isomerase-like protein
MNKRAAALIAIISLFQVTPAFAQHAAQKNALLDVERKWVQAVKDRDTDALDRILSNDFVFTDQDGHVMDKQQYLDGIADSDFEALDFVQMTPAVSGKSGVVTGILHEQGTFMGSLVSRDLRFTDMFVKHHRRWLGLASHGSRLDSQP